MERTMYNNIKEVEASEIFTEEEKGAIKSLCEGANRIQVTIEWGFVCVRKFFISDGVFGIEYMKYERSETDTEIETAVIMALLRSREAKFI